MCGIAGYVDLKGGVKRDHLSKMSREIIHRGPDSSGYFINKKEKVGLAIRRLKIIDLKTGDQPISNEDGSVTVVYNGEIYNYKKLKNKLAKKGHKFKTKSDTEVLVHLYEEYGTSMSKYLNGMFAFAIWDEKNQKLFLSRDRSGIKPLYYYLNENILVFGSEIKTILSSAYYSKKIDEVGLSFYLYLGYLPGKYSIFKGIKKLLPGSSISFSKDNGLEESKYFDLIDDRYEDERTLDEILRKSVRSQLVADVEVGVFLSGGLDSSLITYYISEVEKLKSFSIGFEDSRFDESSAAQVVAKKLGTDHYNETFKSGDVLRLFPKITKKLDEPFADASLFPTYKVSQLARKHVKVALSGDGGDELFGGYPTYQAHLLYKYLSFLPNLSSDFLLSVLDILPEFIINFLPTSFKAYSKKDLAKIVLKGMKMGDVQRNVYWMRTFFLGDKTLGKKPNFSQVEKGIPSLKLVKNYALRGQIIDYHTYLRDDFLVKTDRASMYNSLEVRVPYLDNDVVNFAFDGGRKHLNLINTKLLLRKLSNKYIPEISKRPKKGFGIPLQNWLGGELRSFAIDTLSNDKMRGYIKKDSIRKIWSDFDKKGRNNQGLIWMLVMLSGWFNNWMDD